LTAEFLSQRLLKFVLRQTLCRNCSCQRQ
jgi:hypothetical protein